MKRLLPALIAATLASAPAFAGDEPVVVIPSHEARAFAEHTANYWRQWAQDFAHDLRHELGTAYAPRMGGKVVKGAPYSAEVITETRQMLADGNDISRRKTGAVYRDGEGRTRQETGPEGKERTIFINDPVKSAHYVLTPGSKRGVVTPAPRAMSYRYDTRDKQVVRAGDTEVRIEDGKVFIDGKEMTPGGRIEVNRNGKSIVIDGGNITIDGKPIGSGPGHRQVVVRSVETSEGRKHEEISITPVPPAPPVPPVPGVAPTPPAPPTPPPMLPGVNTLRFECTAKLGKGITTPLGV
jgi:hypothetical protein